MYKILYLSNFQEIKWDTDIIDISMCDVPAHEKKPLYIKIWKKAKQYSNKKINLYSGDAPPLGFFYDVANVKWHLDWKMRPYHPLAWLWELCSTINIHTTLKHDKNIQFSVCSFNGSYHTTRTASCVALLNMGLWHPEVCTKNFVASSKSLEQFDHTFIKTITKTLSTKQLKNFLSSTNSTYTPMDLSSNVPILNAMMQKSFINFVSESEADADLVSVTEKFFLGIIGKTITIGVGQKNWHKTINEFYGFKQYDCFDYGFDSENKFETRLMNVLDQLKSLAKLSKKGQQEIHNRNHDIINYNYEHLTSGNWKKFCQQSLNRLDKLKSESYNTIGE